MNTLNTINYTGLLNYKKEIFFTFVVLVTPLLPEIVDKIFEFTHDAMEHDYDLNITLGKVNLAFKKHDNSTV